MKHYGPLPQVLSLARQLNQVFMNLLVNAAQAIEEQGTITLTTRTEADEVVLEFADDGSGIPPEHLNRIFDPFFTTKPVGMGTGLGLFVAYSIVHKHGGTIEVESAPCKGSLFRLRLPVKGPQETAA